MSRSSWSVASAIAAIYLLSTLPTPLYPIYAEEFGFSPIVLTFVYSVYVVGAVATMFFLGRLGDQIGRRPVTAASLVLAILACVLFLFARSTFWLFPARIVSGLSIALASGVSTAWLVDLTPHRDGQRATRISVIANLLGLALGPFYAGILAQYAPSPLRVSYWVLIAVLVPTVAMVWLTRETREEKPLASASFKPRIGVPKELRSKFFGAAVAAFAVFAVLGFYTALIPGLLSNELHEKNHAVAGGLVFVLFGLGILVNLATPRISAKQGVIVSLWLMIPSLALLLLAEALKSMPLLLVAAAAAGAATGLGYRTSQQAVNEMSPAEKRSEMVSTYLIFCYSGISLPVIGIGLLTKSLGPLLTNSIFAAVVAAASVIALLVERKQDA
jgi:MFS family permease